MVSGAWLKGAQPGPRKLAKLSADNWPYVLVYKNRVARKSFWIYWCIQKDLSTSSCVFVLKKVMGSDIVSEKSEIWRNSKIRHQDDLLCPPPPTPRKILDSYTFLRNLQKKKSAHKKMFGILPN